MSKYSILLVDDEESIRITLARNLGAVGFEVDTARDGQEAIDKLRKKSFDLVITDLVMEEVDGVEVLTTAKEIKPEIMVIVMTGFSSMESATETLQLGAYDYVTKPCNLEALLFKIKRAFRVLEIQKQLREKDEALIASNEWLKREVAERRKAEALLLESESKYRSICESAHSAIIVADEDGRIISWHGGAEQIFGYKNTEVIGQPLTRLMPEKYRGAHISGLKRLRQTGQSRIIGTTVELEGLRKDGSHFPLELSLSTWKIKESRFYSGLIRDISARKKMEEELRNSQRLMIRSEKLASIGILSAGVAHEILNPLNIIGILVQLEFKKDLPPETKERLEKIKEQVNRAAKITNTLREFSHLKKDQIAPVNIHQLFDKTASLIEHDLNVENIGIERLFENDLPAIDADEDKLAQVFLNLLTNARDAMLGGENNKITVEAKSTESGIEIRFSDTGTGIPDTIINKIFDPFFTTKDPGKGTGLGLFITHTIIENMGGMIDVKSELGRGTAFIIHLPIQNPLKP